MHSPKTRSGDGPELACECSVCRSVGKTGDDHSIFPPKLFFAVGLGRIKS